MKAAPEFYTVQQVSKDLRFSATTIRRLISSGELPATKVSGRYQIKSASLREFIAKRTVGSK